ncbi:Eco57I restriction-modification methylase domain-containing protein [Kitasatospora sp. NPDC086801]|uniref:Eco57I restriction-modification methylase domain-containing protein n=1 Tax=Kitasatospora sp. NPDC086801 TaxID=3364066 RepID=UPI003830FC09
MAKRVLDKAKRTGQHFTPTALADFLAERAVNYLPKGRPLRVLDPACGDGELLIAAHSALTQRGLAVGELVGCELDPEAAAVTELRITGVTGGRVHVGDFLAIAKDVHGCGSFDLIITNPPYVRTQVLGAGLSNELAQRFGLGGRVDLTHAFVAMSEELLAPQGVLALLCSNRFLSTKAGDNVRQVLDASFACREVYDLGDTKLFKAAVLPAIVIAVNESNLAEKERKASPFTRVYESPEIQDSVEVESLFEALASTESRAITVEGKSYLVEVGELVAGDPGAPWSLRTKESEKWLEWLRKGTWKTFGELAKTRVGIKTTADSVFIREDWDGLPEEVRPEDHLLFQLLTHENVQSWCVSEASSTRVLYPYDMEKEKRTLLHNSGYPRAMAYFLQHEARLKGRKYVIEGGRQWYEIWVPQRPARWSAPKIVFPDISEGARFAIDNSGAIVNGDCYWISVADLPNEDIAYLMLAVANSKIGLRFYDTVCGNKLYSGRRRWITQYVERFPIPDPSSPGALRAVSIARELSEKKIVKEAREVAIGELESALEEAFTFLPEMAQPLMSLPGEGIAQSILF